MSKVSTEFLVGFNYIAIDFLRLLLHNCSTNFSHFNCGCQTAGKSSVTVLLKENHLFAKTPDPHYYNLQIFFEV